MRYNLVQIGDVLGIAHGHAAHTTKYNEWYRRINRRYLTRVGLIHADPAPSHSTCSTSSSSLSSQRRRCSRTDVSGSSVAYGPVDAEVQPSDVYIPSPAYMSPPPYMASSSSMYHQLMPDFVQQSREVLNSPIPQVPYFQYGNTPASYNPSMGSGKLRNDLAVLMTYLPQNILVTGLMYHLGETRSSTRTIPEPSTPRQRLHRVDKYTDLNDVTWYGSKREFQCVPIYSTNSQNIADHIMVGPVTNVSQENWVVWAKELEYIRWWEIRCEMESYCRLHKLSVPKAISATLPCSTQGEIAQVIERLKSEINQMNQRLDKYHAWHEAAARQDELRTPMMMEVEIDVQYENDDNLSDYPDSDCDDDFVHNFLPSTLPACC
ncbi:Pko r-Gyr intein like [Quillaja saponaria]|uniref:Pko r-Gyr intein like n=1 Tax=Quillaja saponaria TaxID=32244 RepID=A0AAD7LGA1_QUISA|nr:Pko r-Gyr intein like [Quillaja saponaria]